MLTNLHSFGSLSNVGVGVKGEKDSGSKTVEISEAEVQSLKGLDSLFDIVRNTVYP